MTALDNHIGSAPDHRLEVRLCGDPVVSVDDGPAVRVRGRQPQVVLAYLAVAGSPVSRDELAHLLWGDLLPDHWSGALRGVISKVRAALVEAGMADPGLRSELGTVSFASTVSVVTDITVARARLDEAARHLDRGQAEPAVERCVEARAAIAGSFLPHHDSDWGRRQREVIDELAARSTHLHVRALLQHGAPADAASRAAERVVQSPLDEEAHHLLIASLLAAGQRGRATESYQALVDLLASELGLAPARRTTALFDAVAGDRPGGDGGTSSPRPDETDTSTDTDTPTETPTSTDTDTPTETHITASRATDRGTSRRWGPAAGHHPHDADPFVGRHDQLAALHATWAATSLARRPHVVVLEGPPGIGKTRLASRFASALAQDGTRVMWGRARDGAGRAFGPFAEAIDAAVTEDPDVVHRLGPLASGLVTLLPRLRDQVVDYVAPVDDAVARTHLFGAVTATLAALAEDPALLVLDDLHWVSEDSLSLLDAALDGAPIPLLVLATARPEPNSLGAGLMGLQRSVPVSRMGLGGLDVTEIDELVGRGHGGLAHRIHQRTGGLPFYVAELAREARQSGRSIEPDQVPPGVRDWVARRLTVLPPDAHALVSLAAVVAVAGTHVDPDLLEACAPDPDSVIGLCEDLVERGLLAHDQESGSIQFPHAITRDVVYHQLSPARRSRLHRRVADALAELVQATGGDARHGELAEHYHRSGPAGRALAAFHARSAGEEALQQGAWELATTSFELAHRCSDEPVSRTRALIGLGQARHQLGDLEEARRLIGDAAEQARRHDLPVEQARASLALVGRAGRGASTADDRWQIGVLRDALAALQRCRRPRPCHECEIWACHVERELALALLLSPDSADERQELLDRSIARARRLDPPDESALASALLGLRIVKLDAADLESRLADLDEAIAIPRSRLHPELAVAAHTYRHEDLMRAGRIEAARRSLEEAALLAEHYRYPYWQWATTTWRGLEANVDGDLDLAEKLAGEALSMRAEVAEAAACFGVNLVDIRLFQGRADEVIDLLAAAVEANPQIPAYRAVLSLCAAETGDLDLAEASYRSFADHGFTNLPRDTNRFLGLAVLADVAVDVGDRSGGRVLAALLASARGQWVQINCYGGGGAHWGPVSHHLAGLAALDGRVDEARVLLDEAIAASRHAPLVLDRIRSDAERWL